MDPNQQGNPEQEAQGTNQYQSNPMMAPTNPPTYPAGPSAAAPFLREPQFAPQYLHQLQQQQHLQQQLNNFWANQVQEIEETTDFRSHGLPLARIKKIMKADEDVRMISAEAPVVFAKACEMFIMELTMRAWSNAEESKRRTLQKNDIASAISKTDVFDFLVDIVPRDEKIDQEVLAGMPRRDTSAPVENVPYYFMPPPHPHVAGAGGPSYGPPRMLMGRPIVDQTSHGQQPNPFATQMWPSSKQDPPPNPDN
ncbi:hypothetical protein VNO77_01697 [Canavalia gladiata]|uniref:Transcription factor CBF/NF-Y/archaeal histone domain-containing protein n=1 Tax=Canavalia gladiata TaxID=3824 RepID=A0AAN9R576_CANGL